MVALPTLKPVSSSGKRLALRATKLAKSMSPGNAANSVKAASPHKHNVRQPRIPRSALRDIDRILARMAIQRQKIVYGEDIAQIYQERKDNWAYRALECGYRAAIAVPLLVREQPIGAFILYIAQPHAVSSHDTFLLSTAAMQTAIAIQNALLYAEVKDKNAALERANHLKSQFLANVTHELRSPLHSIISYGSLILEGFVDGELTAEQEEHIQFIVRRAEDLSHLVDDMLDLSKIEADRIEVAPEPLTMKPFLTEVVNQLKSIASNKELTLLLEIEEGIPAALADSHRLRQVVINLVSNALKFTDKGGVTIRCNTLRNHDMLCISVSDTGIGIAPAALSYIFEAFRQADGSTTRRFGGTGLGLTIAKKLIELQGGEIAVESIPGEGTTFSFTLPSLSL
jgi:signal transduction histidine kinase